MLPETRDFLIMFTISDLLIFFNTFMLVWNYLRGSIMYLVSLAAIAVICFAISNVTNMYMVRLTIRQAEYDAEHLYINPTGR